MKITIFTNDSVMLTRDKEYKTSLFQYYISMAKVPWKWKYQVFKDKCNIGET